MEEGTSNARLEKVGYYTIGKTIGHGNFANVKIAKHEIARIKVAIKIIDKTKLDDINMIKIEREISLLQLLRHPHIVKLYEIMRSKNYLYLCTEYCRNGELYEYVLKKGRIPEDEAKRIFAQISCAISYLHHNRIVHRDLKVENILLDKFNNVKIIDFGFSNVQDQGKMLTTWCGSPPYAAPELLLGKEYDGAKADMWSLGVVLYILVTGGFPFPSDTMDILKRSVLTGLVKIPFFVSVECSDLIRKMLVVNPVKRYSIHNVFQHRWLAMSSELVARYSSSKVDLQLPTNTQFNASNIPINPTIAVFMQSREKWTEKMIKEAVHSRDFNSQVFGTYELLCDKVEQKSPRQIQQQEYPRRGSRGSILSGKVFDDTPPLTPTISAHHLASLCLSSSSESDDSDGDNNSMISLRKRRLPKHSNFLTTVSSTYPSQDDHRRHSVCIGKDSVSLDLKNQILKSHTGSPQLVHQRMFMETLVKQSNAQVLDNTKVLPFLKKPNDEMPFVLSVPQINKRPSNSDEHMKLTCDRLSDYRGELNIEEEGLGYLTKSGGKRFTVHGALLQESVNNVRHSPYAKSRGAERRSSWAACVNSTQQMVQLEGLHDQELGNIASPVSVSIQALQEEFQQLGHQTSISGSHGMRSLAGGTEFPSGFGCPRISITDENNRSTIPSGSNNLEACSFENKIESLYSPRPATVIGFSSTCHSDTSTPDASLTPTTLEGKSFVSTLSAYQLLSELRTKLTELRVQYTEANEAVDDDHTMCRVSLSDGLEIGVANLDVTRTIADFAIPSVHQSARAEIIRDELIRRLQICDPNGKLE